MTEETYTILYVEDHRAISDMAVMEVEFHFGERVKLAPAYDYEGAVRFLETNPNPNKIFSDGGYKGKEPNSDEGGADLYRYVWEKGLLDRFYFVSGRGVAGIKQTLEHHGLPPIDEDRIFEKPCSMPDIIERIIAARPARPAIANNDAPRPDLSKLRVSRPA